MEASTITAMPTRLQIAEDALALAKAGRIHAVKHSADFWTADEDSTDLLLHLRVVATPEGDRSYPELAAQAERTCNVCICGAWYLAAALRGVEAFEVFRGSDDINRKFGLPDADRASQRAGYDDLHDALDHGDEGLIAALEAGVEVEREREAVPA